MTSTLRRLRSSGSNEQGRTWPRARRPGGTRCWRPAAALLVSFGASASAARAEPWELVLRAGPALPSYEQSLRYEPALPSLPRGVSVRQSGAFELKAGGGLALGAALARSLGRYVAVEVRLDSAGIEVASSGARFEVSVALPPPLPTLSSRLELDAGRIEVDRLTPLSLNLRLRTPGASGVALSAGASYLPRAGLSVVQPVGLGVTGLAGGQLQVATLALRADSRALGGSGGLGANLGASLRASPRAGLGLELEGRVFVFGTRELSWSAEGPLPSSALERQLLQALLERLPPVRFRPTFFQLSLGLSIAF